MSPGTFRQLWRVGDRVKFAHQLRDAVAQVYTITKLSDPQSEPMVELDRLPGQFASHIFVSADYPKDSIVPRPLRPDNPKIERES
jgi:hypothetical protein